MIKKIAKNKIRLRKHARIRKRISGTSAVPRLCVYRSNKYIYCQIVDDSTHNTLVHASSKEKGFTGEHTANIEASKEVGKMIAERAKAKGIDRIVFDRSGYIYHGRIAALADAAREGGLEF